MKKRLALFLSASTVSLFIVGAVACSSDNPPSSFPGDQSDSAVFDQGTFTKDGDITPGSDATIPVTCDPHLPATFTASFTAPTKSASCSTADIKGYYAQCLGNLSDPDGGAACTAWKAAAPPACSACIETPDNNGPIQFYSDRLYYVLNVAGCLSIERKETAEGTCAAAFGESIQCQRDSCSDCLTQPGAVFKDFTGCQTAAKNTACQGYEGKLSAACGTTFNDPDGGAYDCFHQGNEPQETQFERMIAVFCGE